MPKLLVLDTFNFLHRAYHALPKTFTDKEGNPTNAVYGVTSMLINVLLNHKPDYIIAASDSKKPTFRVEEFTGYKAHRKPMEDDLSSQIPKVFEIFDAFDVKQITVDGYEADDVIGTITERFKDKDLDIVVVSNDRDLWQLVSDKVSIMLPKGANGAEFIGPGEVMARMGLTPDQIPDYKGIRGDSSDNIPGVYGIGEKGAKKLLDEYKTIEGIYYHISEITPSSLQKKLAVNAENAVMSKKLATIITDVPFDLELSDCLYRDFVADEVRDILTSYNFKSLLRKLGLTELKEENPDQLSLF